MGTCRAWEMAVYLPQEKEGILMKSKEICGRESRCAGDGACKAAGKWPGDVQGPESPEAPGIGRGEPCSPPVWWWWWGVMTPACDILCPRGREAAPGRPVEARPAQKSVASWEP